MPFGWRIPTFSFCANKKLDLILAHQEQQSMDLQTIKQKLAAAAAAQADESNTVQKGVVALDGLKAASDAQKAQIAQLLANGGAPDPADLQALADGADAIAAAAGAASDALKTAVSADAAQS